MKLFFIISLALFIPLSHANDYPRHMVIISTSGLGASGAYEKMDPDSTSNFKDFSIMRGNIALNYAYTILPQLQLGGFFSNKSEDRKFKTKTGFDEEVQYKTLLWGVAVLWNFSTELQNSFYTGFILSILNHEEEFDKNVFNYLEDDKNAETYELAFGKRFNLKKLGLDVISYSPSLSVFVQRARKDYEDDGIGNSMGVNVLPLKFDILF